MNPLDGIRVINLAINLPGPTTAARLTEFGAQVTKVEPPTGDPMKYASAEYYAELTAGQEVVAINLKDEGERQKLFDLLGKADLFLTSHRTQALEKLGLGWDTLHATFPKLCQLAIVGELAPRDNVPGHDLTYQALEGLLDPPHMPRALIADLGGAERAFSAALAILLQRERTGEAAYVQVALADAAKAFTGPLRRGFTKPGGGLGGGFPGYGIYAAQDGYVAIGALEPHFMQRVEEALELPGATKEQLAEVFATKPKDEWERWAEERDIPLVAVRDVP
jgi:crotonobetainyl-CoA:carnitine CoA-transferase CaiB-like acyl-CoA transferase